MVTYERLYNNKGELAVLYGNAWSTWDAKFNGLKGKEAYRLALDKRVIEFWLSNKNYFDMADFLESIEYTSVVSDSESLKIAWIPKGTNFFILNYKGYETIETPESCNMIVA